MAPSTSRSSVPWSRGKAGDMFPLDGEGSNWLTRPGGPMIAAAVFVTALAAQALPPPSQAATPPPTGLIVGRVVDAASGRPVAGAVVSLVGGNVAFTGPGVNGPRAITNGTGYFVFRKLAKGTYSLTAARPGYVDGAYGRRKPGGMSMPLALDEAQRVNDVVIPIWRHATISGTV